MQFRAFICAFLTLSIILTRAQEGRKPTPLLCSSGPDGNYLYIMTQRDIEDPQTDVLIDHFLIKRATINADADSLRLGDYEGMLKEVGIARKPLSLKDLRASLPNNGSEGFKKVLGLRSDEELVEYIHKHPKPEGYGLLYSMVETRMLLGHVFLDKTVKTGSVYLYHVFSVDRLGKQQLWGMSVSLGKAGNYRLPYFRAISKGYTVRDSSITMSWAIPINRRMDTIPLPRRRYRIDRDGNLYKTFFAPTGLRSFVELGVNGNWERQHNLIFPQFSRDNDTMFVNFGKRCNPNSLISARLTLVDEVYNEGGESDTISTYIVTEMNAPHLSKLTVRDTLNGLVIRWPGMQPSPFVTGIQIIRYGLNEQADTLPLVPITDSFYFDYSVKAGVNYRYEARPLFLPGIVYYQKTPANSFGTVTKFSRPSPPFHLTASNEGKNIRLRWESANDPTISNFFVFRGTNLNNLSLRPGMVKGNIYLDTSIALYGETKYFYSVMSQNLMQDTSLHSDIVAIRPDRKIDILPPSQVSCYYSNGKLKVFWKDARKLDNRVEKFTVQKRLAGDTAFSCITPNAVVETSLEDTGIVEGLGYQYRVASLSNRGDTSAFSEVSEYRLPLKKVAVLGQFNLMNTRKGILVLLPTVVVSNRKGYNIYRRTLDTPHFTKIATLRADEFKYEDTQVEKGTTYIYGVSITEMDGREGVMGNTVNLTKY